MKKTSIILLLTIFILFGCKEKNSNLTIVLSKIEKNDSTSIIFNRLYLKKSDSIFFKLERPTKYNFKDTIKIKKIPIGTYTLEYTDIIGNEIVKTVNISKRPKQIYILTDSICSEKFKSIIPYNNLKSNNSYTVEMKGGCIASYYGYYTIFRIKNTYYFESNGTGKKILKQSEIDAIKKFESELISVNEKNICLSTDRKTFKIISSFPKEIVDNTCNWNGWSNLFSTLNK